MEYENGSVCSLEELLAFGDRVFGEEVQPGGFAALLPKLAGEHGIPPEHYRVIREDGVLRAMLLAQPLILRVGGEALTGWYIGSVSVDPEARNRGYMQLLLAKIREEMQEAGCQFAALGGQRQRYGYAGFEISGMEMHCDLTRANVKHAYRNVSADGIRVLPLSPEDPLLGEAYSLSAARPYGADRTEEGFYDLLRSWRGEPYALQIQGEFGGYLSVVREGNARVRVQELQLAGTPFLPAVYQACMNYFEADTLSFGLDVADRKALEELCDVCEGYQLSFNHSYSILEFAPFVRGLLRHKQAYAGLTDGQAAFDVEGEQFTVRVSDGVPEVLAGEPDEEEEPIALTRRQAMQWMFSPLSCALRFPEQERVPADWFPLPLYLSPLDAC